MQLVGHGFNKITTENTKKTLFVNSVVSVRSVVGFLSYNCKSIIKACWINLARARRARYNHLLQ